MRNANFHNMLIARSSRTNAQLNRMNFVHESSNILRSEHILKCTHFKWVKIVQMSRRFTIEESAVLKLNEAKFSGLFAEIFRSNFQLKTISICR